MYQPQQNLQSYKKSTTPTNSVYFWDGRHRSTTTYENKSDRVTR